MALDRLSNTIGRLAVVALVAGTASGASAASTCYGTPSHGRLEGGAQLPVSGKNFTAYTPLGAQLDRTWVHDAVAGVMLAAWRELETTAPGVTFVYGETGHARGGPLPPHRTHEAGVSVDFMVPVRDGAGRSVRLPGSAANKYGYAWEFDGAGKADGLTIDYEALAEHLVQLDRAGKQRNTPIQRVIFDPRLTAHLYATRHGAAMRALPFMKQKPWIRHDEHYHVDFAIACRPYSAK